MDPPLSGDPPTKPSGAFSFPCPHCDPELVHKIAQLLLPGLSAACIDSTTGDFFRSPALAAPDLRKSLIDHLSRRTETYLSSPDLLPPDPIAIISDLIEDFAASKRNILSRFSNWILSDAREDRIDAFAHEMEANRFWLLDRREAIAAALLRNLDYKKEWHCAMRFEEEMGREAHGRECGFRPVGCGNEGCKVKICAAREEEHEGVCGYRVVPCDQRCGEMVLRREMDRHCVTVCGMRLVNCPFYQVGCESGVPRCRVEEHCRDELRRHLVCVLAVVVHPDVEEGSSEDLWMERAKALEEAQSENELAEALNVRSLVTKIKNLEAKMMKSQEDDSSSNRPSN